ncbi:MAG: tetratricopeptide repeat protein [Bacteroidetes bacterium]|nr:tetratricopeptide repeat protein [Bacteroidota bacterium]
MNKLKHIITLVTVFFCLSINTFAQVTRAYTQDVTLFEDAKMLYIKKQYVPAITEFETFLKTSPGPNFTFEANAYIGLSRLKLDKRNANRYLTQLIRNEPEHKLNTEITYELGLYYFNKGKHAKSLKYFEQIAETDVTKAQGEELAFKKGYAYFKNKEYTKAKFEFKKIMNGSGQYATEANYYYGYQCYVLKDYACAIATFNKIGDKGPQTMKLYLAQIYYEQEEYEKAFDIVKNVRLKKKANEVELLTGKIQYQLGNKSVALRHFDNYAGDVSKLFPDEIYQFANANFEAGNLKRSTEYFVLVAKQDNAIGQAANYHLGVSDVQTNRKERALNAFAEAKRKNYDPKISEIAAYNYAKLAAELQKNNLAINAIKEFLTVYPRSEYANSAKTMMADIFLSTKNYKAAIALLEEIGNLNNESKLVYQELTFHRGEELYLNKQYQDADVFFKKSLKYPKDPVLESQAYFWRAEIAYKVSDNNESINLMNRFMSSASSNRSKNKTYGYYAMGYNYLQKKDYPKAQNYFAKFEQYEKYTAENRTLYIDNMQRLADCYFLNGQYSPAIKAYDFVIKKDYKNGDYAIYQQGMLYGLQERRAEKINVLKKIPQDFKTSIYVDDALFETAREYLTLGNFSTAESIFNLIISQHDYSPYLPESYLKLGLLSHYQSKDAAALRYYKTVVERFPKTKEANEALSFIEIIYTNQGTPQKYFEYAANVPGAGVSLSYQDSVLYEQAIRTYNAENYVGASRELGAYIDKFGNNGYFIIPANYFKAECDYYTDKVDIALTHYDYVATQGTNDYTEKSLIKLASTFFYRKNYLKALGYYERLEPLASKKTTFISATQGQMRCHNMLESYDKAKKKAVELLPMKDVPTDDLVEAHMLLGNIELRKAKLRTAKYHYDFVVDNSRNEITAEALYRRADINFQLGDLDSTRSDVYTLSDDYSAYDFWVVKGFILLSDVYVQEEDLFQAKATLQSIIDNYENEEDGLLDICRNKIADIERMESTDEKAEKDEE